MIRYLLDTNIVIYVIKKRPLEVLQAFNKNSGRMAISSITLAELFHGAEKSARCAENLTVIDDFTSRLEVLPYTPKRLNITGLSVLPWKKMARLLASMTCTSQHMHEVRDLCW